MIEKYIYIERLRKPAAKTCDGNCGRLLNSGFTVKIYINKAQDLESTKWYCRNCTRLLYPYYFKNR